MFFRTVAPQDTKQVWEVTEDTIATDMTVYKLVVLAGATLSIPAGVTVLARLVESMGAIVCEGTLDTTQPVVKDVPSFLLNNPGTTSAGFFETRRTTGSLNSYPS